MKINISRETLLKPLQLVSGAVEKRQTLPILGNVLLSPSENQLSVTATDLEVELIGRVEVPSLEKSDDITVPGKKLLDIIRSLPVDAELEITEQKDRLLLRSGKSRFTLSTLPANEFPNVEDKQVSVEIRLPQNELKHLIEQTHFAMAHQDVRYYLNGLLFDIKDNELKLVATDGHRLALASFKKDFNNQSLSCILPRKGALELMRLLEDTDEEILLQFNENHAKAVTQQFTFTSKLIEGKFPDYQRVIPKSLASQMKVDADLLKQVLARVAILSNQKYRGVRLHFANNLLRIFANNPEHEEAEEEIEVKYDGNVVELGFNVNYLLDVASHLHHGEARISLNDSSSSILVESLQDDSFLYVVMPMRL